MFIGWITPDGEMLECGRYEHGALAQEIANGMHIPTSSGCQADDLLCDRGFCRCTLTLLGKQAYDVFHTSRTPYTDRQIAALTNAINDYIAANPENGKNDFALGYGYYEFMSDHMDGCPLSWFDSSD